MPGTKEGGRLAAATNKARYGEDFYGRIGSKGGSTKTRTPKGFAARPDLARSAGATGGRKSRRRKRQLDASEVVKTGFLNRIFK